MERLHYRKKLFVKLGAIGLMLSVSIYSASQNSNVQYLKQISQHGITWTFSKPVQCGRFITGDWWVIGPVTIEKIDPAPGPAMPDDTKVALNKWGDSSLKKDTLMRNGSMVVYRAGNHQGYDSRNSSYHDTCSIRFPFKLNCNLTLVSTISNPAVPVDNFCKDLMWESEQRVRVTLRTASVLTCLSEVPPPDAFRPPFAGNIKPIFRLQDVNWDALPSLDPSGPVPSWKEFERYFSRCWIDHLMSWEQQELVPNENMPNYGREHARIVSIASLMLCLDVPQVTKEKLAVGMIQHGIDLYGTAVAGGYWNEGGGHSSGRKWPIMLAGILLNDERFFNLPGTAVFQEDTQTYFGEGWFGQKALWQMIIHHGQRQPYEEKHPGQWEKWDKTSESYRVCCTSSAWVGMALAARQMKAIKLWGHDAFFDYVDRWMRIDDPYAKARGNYPRPASETKTFDPFVTEMWQKYRELAPDQEYSGKNYKWVWIEGKGIWTAN